MNVAVVGDEVMVTECGNDGRILVSARELKYVCRIMVHKRELKYVCRIMVYDRELNMCAGSWCTTEN